MYVLIDDLRDIDKMVSPDIDIDQKLTIRTFDEGMKFISHTNLRDIILFMDNDLGEPVKEGYDILSHAIEHNNYPLAVVLVTSNPVAKSKMRRILTMYTQVGDIFKRKEHV